MKKILGGILLFSVLIFAGRMVSYAFESVWRSSNTQTADTLQNLCFPNIAGQTAHAILHGICVNTGAAGSFSVFASSGVVSSTITVINTAAVVPCMFYDVEVSSGLTYTNSATANVTVLYACY